MSWRNITVKGKQYRWRGNHFVVIQDSEGKRVSAPSLTAAQVKRITELEWEQGHWYGTRNGMLTPVDIKNYIIWYV